jgi:CDP-glucose 4,6-dehydratase
MRAGNVIGGGDFASDRIVPDCVRAASRGETILVRNPYSIRPYQHVLEPITAYLYLACLQYEDRSYADQYNIGPDDIDFVSTGELVQLFCKLWGEGLRWKHLQLENTPHEAGLLKLDCTKFKSKTKWRPRWHIEESLRKTVDFSKSYYGGDEMRTLVDEQIKSFIELRDNA